MKAETAERVTLMNLITQLHCDLGVSLCVQVQPPACDCAACASYSQVHAWNERRMSSTFVTLAEVLEARGGPLLEEEVWSLLLGSAEALVDVSYKGNRLRRNSLFLYVM